MAEPYQPVRRTHAIAPRDTRATRGMIDLGNFYLNALDDDLHHMPANTLSALAHGVQTLAGIPFDVRGVIQLAGRESREITTVIYPAEVLGIPVGMAADRLHLLHAAAWGPEDGEMTIGEYVVHYANGEQRSILLIHGDNIAGWWAQPGSPLPENAALAWEGSNPRVADMGLVLRLYAYTWPNLMPGVEIESIDFVSRLVHSAPMLLAITAE